MEFLSFLFINGWFDKINSFIEILILIPFANDCYHIHKVKTSISLSLKSQICWFVYCMWGAFYFWALGQTFSMAACMLWVCCYVVKIWLVIYYGVK